MISARIPTAPERSGDGAVRLKRFASRVPLGAAAAVDIAAALRKVLARPGPARMVFASAPSQAETLAALACAPRIDWSRVHAFHMDEYIGLASDAPQRFGNWLHQHFLSRVPVGAAHLIEPGPDPRAAAAQYAARLAEAPIDIVCLGIGVNGHIAFNDPPVADFEDPLAVKIVTLDAVCRQQQVDEACFARLEDVPMRAITLTVPRLLDAAHLFCMVPGAIKRTAVAAALHGPISTECPASALRRHPDCTLYVDAESAPA